MMENERFNYILKRKKKLKLEFNFLIYLVFLLLLKPTVLESEPSLRYLNNNESEIHLVISKSKTRFYSKKYEGETPYAIIINGEEETFNFKLYNLKDDINNITLKFNVRIKSCAFMFEEINNIIEIDLSNLDISKVINMESMFFGYLNLKKINFGNINTTSVTNIKRLFYYCVNLKSIDLSNFITSSFTTMSEVIKECHSLTSLDLTNINSSNFVDMYDMFCNCINIIKIELSKL